MSAASPNNPATPALPIELAALLATGQPPRPLSDAERDLTLTALAELPRAHATIARLSMLLASHEEDAAAIERSIRATLPDDAAIPIAHGFDHPAAAQARAELIDAARRANSLAAIAHAALAFAVRLAGLPTAR